MFSGNAWLFLEKTDQEYLNIEVLVENFKKTKVANLPFFKQINTENRIAICQIYSI